MPDNYKTRLPALFGLVELPSRVWDPLIAPYHFLFFTLNINTLSLTVSWISSTSSITEPKLKAVIIYCNPVRMVVKGPTIHVVWEMSKNRSSSFPTLTTHDPSRAESSILPVHTDPGIEQRWSLHNKVEINCCWRSRGCRSGVLGNAWTLQF